MKFILTKGEVDEQKLLYDKWLNSFTKPQTVEKSAFGIWLASAKANKKELSYKNSDESNVKNLMEALRVLE